MNLSACLPLAAIHPKSRDEGNQQLVSVRHGGIGGIAEVMGHQAKDSCTNLSGCPGKRSMHESFAWTARKIHASHMAGPAGLICRLACAVYVWRYHQKGCLVLDIKFALASWVIHQILYRSLMS